MASKNKNILQLSRYGGATLNFTLTNTCPLDTWFSILLSINFSTRQEFIDKIPKSNEFERLWAYISSFQFNAAKINVAVDHGMFADQDRTVSFSMEKLNCSTETIYVTTWLVI